MHQELELVKQEQLVIMLQLMELELVQVMPMLDKEEMPRLMDLV